MIRLQIRLFGPYFSSFSTNSYGYSSQMSQNLASNSRIFASARIVRQPPRVISFARPKKMKVLAGIPAGIEPLGMADDLTVY